MPEIDEFRKMALDITEKCGFDEHEGSPSLENAIETALRNVHNKAVEEAIKELSKHRITDKYKKCCKQAMHDNTITNIQILSRLRKE